MEMPNEAMDAEQIAEGLSDAGAACIRATQYRQGWFAARDVHAHNSAGFVLTRLGALGLYKSRTDRSKWGRSQYRETSLCAAVRAILESRND